MALYDPRRLSTEQGKIIGRGSMFRRTEGHMRWTISWGLLIFAASIVAIMGIAAEPARASGTGSSFSLTFGSSHGSHGYYRNSHHRHRGWHRQRHPRRRHGGVVFHAPWPVPAPPRVVVVETPRNNPVPSPSGAEPYCREFQKRIIIDGRPEKAFGIACRQPDGTWKLQP